MVSKAFSFYPTFFKNYFSSSSMFRSRCMYGARSERNEYLLLHSFYNEGYICPDRPNWKTGFKEPLFVDENNLGEFFFFEKSLNTN